MVSSDEFMSTFLVVSTLTLQTSGSSGTEYGQWEHYGVTDPLWLGYVMEFCFSSCWFIHLFTIVGSLITITCCLIHGTNIHVIDCVLASSLYLVANLVYHMIQLPLIDVSYWFNLFVQVDRYDLKVGNAGMFVCDEIPLFMYLCAIVVTPVIQYRRYKKKKMRDATDKVVTGKIRIPEITRRTHRRVM